MPKGWKRLFKLLYKALLLYIRTREATPKLEPALAVLPKSVKQHLSYGFFNRELKVHWVGDSVDTIYTVEPPQPNSFLDSSCLYMLMRYLKAYPDGMTFRYDNVLYEVYLKGEKPTDLPYAGGLMTLGHYRNG